MPFKDNDPFFGIPSTPAVGGSNNRNKKNNYSNTNNNNSNYNSNSNTNSYSNTVNNSSTINDTNNANGYKRNEYILPNGNLMISISNPLNKKQKIQKEVQKFKWTPEILVNKSVALFGPTGTGKTVITKDILFNVKEEFPVVLVFCPTNQYNNDYSNTLPAPCIHGSPSDNIIKKINKRQQEATEYYNIVNDINILFELYKMIGCPQKILFKKIEQKGEQELERLKRHHASEDDLDETISKYKRLKAEFIKQHIKRKEHIFRKNINQLSTLQQKAFMYRNFNPKMLIIFDDCMTEINTMIKKDKEKTLEKFFFKGRHINITMIYCLQAVKKEGLSVSMRENLIYNVFTSQKMAQDYFTQGSFSSDEKKEAKEIAERIYQVPGNDGKCFHKVIYSQRLQPSMQCVKADKHPQFTVGSKPLKQMCELVKKDKQAEYMSLVNNCEFMS